MGKLSAFVGRYSHTIRNPPGNTDNFTLFIVWSTSDELQSVDLEESFDGETRVELVLNGDSVA